MAGLHKPACLNSFSFDPRRHIHLCRIYMQGTVVSWSLSTAYTLKLKLERPGELERPAKAKNTSQRSISAPIPIPRSDNIFTICIPQTFVSNLILDNPTPGPRRPPAPAATPNQNNQTSATSDVKRYKAMLVTRDMAWGRWGTSCHQRCAVVICWVCVSELPTGMRCGKWCYVWGAGGSLFPR